jgi:hypothetical protein
MSNYYYMADFAFLKPIKLEIPLSKSNPAKYKSLVDAENAKNASLAGVMKKNNILRNAQSAARARERSQAIGVINRRKLLRNKNLIKSGGLPPRNYMEGYGYLEGPQNLDFYTRRYPNRYWGNY